MTTFVIGDVELILPTPYCDCVKQGHGFTKREDGGWVRPCCMRPTRQAYERLNRAPR